MMGLMAPVSSLRYCRENVKLSVDLDCARFAFSPTLLLYYDHSVSVRQ